MMGGLLLKGCLCRMFREREVCCVVCLKDQLELRKRFEVIVFRWEGLVSMHVSGIMCKMCARHLFGCWMHHDW